LAGGRRAVRSGGSASRRPSRKLALWLGVSFVATLGVLLLCAALEVKLGQGYFYFRYSPLRQMRTLRMLPMALLGFVAAGGVWMLARPVQRDRVIGGAALVVALIAAAAWTWYAPPAYLRQQWFNMSSPSTDGAFVLEARLIGSLPRYLRDFPQRLRATPQELMGTRVLSNPPGATIVSYAEMALAPERQDAPSRLARELIDRENMRPEDAGLVASALRIGALWVALWALSGVAACGLGRVFLSPAGAAVFAIVVTFNPCTVHFVPGKDPAQLLTINAMLWAWFAGWKRRSAFLAATAGALLVIGSTLSLVHIWVALAAFAASAATSRHNRRVLLTRAAGPATAGALLAVLLVYLATGWNLPATLWAVSRRWSELQRTFTMNRPAWYVIGLPIFLLFVSPGVWALAGLGAGRARARWRNLGMRLAVCTVAAMLFIYFVVGLTYELPRLWVAFLPPLTLGLAAASPLLAARPRAWHPRVALALALIVVAQVAFTAFHWTVLDARETEYRLTTNRLYE
jgi:hypothetical protein